MSKAGVRAVRFVARALVVGGVLLWVVLGCERNPPCPPPAGRVEQREIVRDVFGDAAADDFEARCPG